MKYYAVADVHGFYTPLKTALDEAGFFADKEPHTLILCGDALDRGNEARELVDLLISLKERGELIYVLGNHEDLFVQCLQEISRGGVFAIAAGMSHHYTNGTWDSLLQLSGMSEREALENPGELVSRVMNSRFYKELLPCAVDFFETDSRIFVHGWIPSISDGYGTSLKYRYDAGWREADALAVRRARWLNGMELACKHRVTEPGKTIVCGHWHTSYGHHIFERKCTEWGPDADFSPFYADGIIAIDACTAASGRVNCLVFEE